MWFRGRGKADRAIAAYQRELVDTHYREVENMYRQMRMWRHDYRNHLQTMKALDTPIKSGNAMADAILSSKMSLAQAPGIDVRSSSAFRNSICAASSATCSTTRSRPTTGYLKPIA